MSRLSDRTPSGTISLEVALERIGNAKFPGVWDGSEVVLVRPCPIRSPWFAKKEDFIRLQRRAYYTGSTMPQLGCWHVFGVDEVFENQGDAQKAWAAVEPELRAVHQATLDGIERFETAAMFLIEELSSERLVAFLWNRETGEQRRIPKKFWDSDRAADIFRVEGTLIPTFGERTIDSSDLLLAAKAFSELLRQVESRQPQAAKANVETECERWLFDAMQASPERRPKPYSDFFRKARREWPNGLSERGFRRAWERAIRRSQAHAWSLRGRPPSNK